MPMPTVVLKSLAVGTVSDEKRTQAGYSEPANRPTFRSSGRSGRTRNTPCATPCGLRKTGRSAGHWPRAMRPACTMATNISTSDAIGSAAQSTAPLPASASEDMRCLNMLYPPCEPVRRRTIAQPLRMRNQRSRSVRSARCLAGRAASTSRRRILSRGRLPATMLQPLGPPNEQDLMRCAGNREGNRDFKRPYSLRGTVLLGS